MTKASSREISELKQEVASLTKELSSLVVYKTKFEQLKKENQKLIEIEEKYEEIEQKLGILWRSDGKITTKDSRVPVIALSDVFKEQGKVQEYWERVKELEEIVKKKDIELEKLGTLSKQNKSLKIKLEQVNKAYAAQQVSTVSLERYNSVVKQLEDELNQKQRDIEEYKQIIHMYTLDNGPIIGAK